MSKHHVTKREAQAVAAYAADLCALLHMPGWRIQVQDQHCVKDAHAEVDWVDGKHVAQLWLAKDWMQLSEKQRRETITHEVCHLLHARVSDTVHDDSKPLMRKHEHTDWWRRVQREFELMVDHLATFLADTHTLEKAWDAAHGRGQE